MAGIAGYLHNVGPDQQITKVVDFRARITVLNTVKITVKVQQ